MTDQLHRLTTSALALCLAGLALSACGSSGRTVPDEFVISRQAPLAVPPDYNLRPPRPGEPRPQDISPQGQALEALFGPGIQAPPMSQSEQSMLDAAGATRMDGEIRSTLRDDGTRVVDKGTFLKTLIDGQPGDTQPAVAAITG